MSPLVILRRIARGEFDVAADWYEARSAGRGVAFTTAVREFLSRIATRPRSHPVIHDDIREALLTRYPCAVSYRIATDRIDVLAIFHTARDPAEWQGRA